MKAKEIKKDSRKKAGQLRVKKSVHSKKKRKTKPQGRSAAARKLSSKERKKQQFIRKVKKLTIELLISLAVTILLTYTISLFTFTLPKMSGYSMASELEDGDRIFVSKISKVERFSLIYFKVPNRKDDVSVSRVIGLPGEEISYVQDELLVNGELKTERFLAESLKEARAEGYQLTEDFSVKEIPSSSSNRIPEGKYLVLGDNRSFATDSRYYGLVDAKDIIGVAQMKLFPLHEMKEL